MIPDGVTFDQLRAISSRASVLRQQFRLPAPTGTASERVEFDAKLVAMLMNPNHDARGRFATAGGGTSVGYAHGRRSTPEERAAAKAAYVANLEKKWGPSVVAPMASWMDQFTPAEAEDRRRRLSEAIAALPDTELMNAQTVDGAKVPGFYTQNRTAKHNAVIEDYKKRVGWDDVPSERDAILSGGLGGAGKGTVLTAMNIDKSKYITVDPDELKGLMAKHGLVPDPKKLGLKGFDPPVRPMELAALIHEESSHLSKRVAFDAMEAGKNVILDNTMGSDSVFKKVADLKAKGYTVNGIFVDVSPEMSIESALARHMNGTASPGPDQLGGRFVDPKLAAAQTPKDPQYRSANRERFEQIKDQLDRAVVIDNEGYAQRPTGFSPSVWGSFSSDARAYVLRNLMTKSTGELMAYARSM